MIIKYQFKSINPLLLIPSLLLAYDFLPEWYIYACSIQLAVITFFRLHRFLGYINFYFLYQIFQTVGNQIIPETMIPSLATLLLAQLIYNKAINRDESFIFFLWLGIFSVFSSSFNYLVYASSVLIYFFLQQSTDNSLSLRAIIRTFIEQRLQLLFTAIVAIVLFIFFPRFHNFLPSANNVTKGTIGYSKTVNNSTTTNLELSSKVAFYAEMDNQINPELLYWRGRIHTHTDGYNWSTGKLAPSITPEYTPIQSIKVLMKYEQDFEGDVMILDHPYKILETNFSTYSIKGTDEYRFYRKRKKATITTLSVPKNQAPIQKIKRISDYTYLPDFIPKSVKLIVEQIPSNRPGEVINSFRNYLVENGFSYTLKPGSLPTVKDFIEKKMGYCTHFASLLGVILRLKKIPTRLVSGFQGGEFNEFGNFYIVKSNDAHTWVEYHDNGIWKRVDPTGFVSPGRIALGGNRFLANPNPTAINNKEQNIFIGFYNQFKLQLDNINYKVSLYFDNYDRDKQTDISSMFKVHRKTFYAIGVLIGVLLIGIYLFLTRTKKNVSIHPIDQILQRLDKKLKLEHKLLDQFTIKSMHDIIESSPYSNSSKEEIKNILHIYELNRYAGKRKKQKLKDLIAQLELKKESL